MEIKKTFLLGVGCQKGGTTWLYNYLQKHPNCDLGFMKEYHLFDGLYCRYSKKLISKVLANTGNNLTLQSERVRAGGPASDAELANQLLRASFFLNPVNYANYFCQLNDSTPEIRLVGDITPAYGMLTAHNYQSIRSLLEPYGFRIKVVFLMRDPVDRCCSAARMFAGARPEAESLSLEQIFRDRSTATGNELRTRYERTIASLEDAFAAEDIYYGFYESLFTEKGLGAIMDFLELPLETAEYNVRVNSSSSRGSQLSAEALKTTRQFYDETYRFCSEKFGKKHIDMLWPYASWC